MSRRARSEADANRHLATPDRARKRRSVRTTPRWSLPLTTVLKAIAALVAALVVLDLAGVL